MRTMRPEVLKIHSDFLDHLATHFVTNLNVARALGGGHSANFYNWKKNGLPLIRLYVATKTGLLNMNHLRSMVLTENEYYQYANAQSSPKFVRLYAMASNFIKCYVHNDPKVIRPVGPPQALVKACDELSISEVARCLGTTRQTLSQWLEPSAVIPRNAVVLLEDSRLIAGGFRAVEFEPGIDVNAVRSSRWYRTMRINAVRHEEHRERETHEIVEIKKVIRETKNT